MKDVTVRAAGHMILEGVNVEIAAGEHVAVVGVSGAGKSSLVGLLLGWHRAAAGRVVVGGRPIDDIGTEALCRQIAWVDPAVHVWNRPFIDNLWYGSSPSANGGIGAALDAADLVRVLQTMPDGLQTPLGEGGSRVSGGEGQRVRFGRALLRPDVRLAILDEPFRGLERDRRRELLVSARRAWREATMLCITHDISETQAFDRVLVVDAGRIVEDGVPGELAARADSRYRRMLDGEEAVLRGLWDGAGDGTAATWRHIRLVDGVIVDGSNRMAS